MGGNLEDLDNISYDPFAEQLKFTIHTYAWVRTHIIFMAKIQANGNEEIFNEIMAELDKTYQQELERAINSIQPIVKG